MKKTTKQSTGQISDKQYILLILLRIFVGWHILYEGLAKLFNPDWTAKAYLAGSEGFLKPAFQMLAESNVLPIVDFINIWGLILIGALLILGFASRLAAICGVILLGMYYLAYPPFLGSLSSVTDGNSFIVNKNLIEIAALSILYVFPTDEIVGVKRIFQKNKTKQL